jgi:poly(A) polymerase
MLRAVALAARLDFTIDPPVLDAIRTHRHDIARSSAPRLLEEYYKILRAGAAEKTFRLLDEVGLLEPISAELHKGARDPLWHSLASLDAYRRRFESTPDTLANAILLGSLLVPLGMSPAWGRAHDAEETPKLGTLPLARRDIERLRQLLGLQRRFRDLGANPRTQRALIHRSIFREALTWLEIHGGEPGLVEHWKALQAEAPAPDAGPADPSSPVSTEGHVRRRRRRRRRRARPAPS